MLLTLSSQALTRVLLPRVLGANRTDQVQFRSKVKFFSLIREQRGAGSHPRERAFPDRLQVGLLYRDLVSGGAGGGGRQRPHRARTAVLLTPQTEHAGSLGGARCRHLELSISRGFFTPLPSCGVDAAISHRDTLV